MRLIHLYLAAAIASLLITAWAATLPGRRKWIVMVIGTLSAMLSAGAVVVELV